MTQLPGIYWSLPRGVMLRGLSELGWPAWVRGTTREVIHPIRRSCLVRRLISDDAEVW
ncbi:hypothetical protein [Schlesneria sp. DSM 10557]|uniref:hypothetical protein n=1 Tax=Schlesneria sp. DSM 10557 TaxID=3044399 RepID=UPI0035A16FA3